MATNAEGSANGSEKEPKVKGSSKEPKSKDGKATTIVTVVAVNSVQHNRDYYAPGQSFDVTLEDAETLKGGGYVTYETE